MPFPLVAARTLIKRALTPRTSPKRLGALLGRLQPVWPRDMIRVGNSEADGGYLLPNDLEGIEYCFSPGVGAVATFEKDLLNRGVRSFLADFSVSGPPVGLDCVFDKKFLGMRNDEEFITLDGWINKYLPPGYSKPMLLQMDIEGAEYDVLRYSPLEYLQKFRIIVVEFHGLENIDLLPVFQRFEAVIERLLPHFRIVHMHPNNAGEVVRLGTYEVPAVVEITFLARNRDIEFSNSGSYPHPLDRKNVSYLPEVTMPRCWYAPGA